MRPITPGLSIPPSRRPRAGGAFVALALALAGRAAGQCAPAWSSFQDVYGAYALAVHDEDGPGPLSEALYVGNVNVPVGGVPVNYIARYDGWAFSTLGPGLDEYDFLYQKVHALRDASGSTAPGLATGGFFDFSGGRRLSKSIARWHQGAWRSMGPSPFNSVYSLGVFDEDGAGPNPPRFFAGGRSADGIDPDLIGLVRWDGFRWSSVDGGIRLWQGLLGAYPFAFEVYDEDGQGPAPPALFISGYFVYAGGVEARFIARWDGQAWSPVGELGTNDAVRALAVFDEDGPGLRRPALFAAGDFDRVGGPSNWIQTGGGLARWDGQRWSAVAGWRGGVLQAAAAFDDDGPGPNKPALFVTGFNVIPNGREHNNIAKWDGERWHPLAGGLTGFGIGTNGRALAVYDEDGPGPNPGGLYVGGVFPFAGGLPSSGFARWGCPLPPRCSADCDQSTGPTVLDVFDFLCFQNRYEINDPSACDCDVSTGARLCDLFDFLCFQNAFAAGCP